MHFQYGDATMLLIYTGLRIGELLALKWRDLDMEKRTLYIHAGINNVAQYDETSKIVGRHDIETTPKTSTSVRRVPLSKKAMYHLRRLAIINKMHVSPNEYIVKTSTNQMPNRSNITRTLKAMQRVSGTSIQDGGLHTCRHTFASILLDKGVDIKIISNLLGHASVSTTYDIYAHIIPERRHTAVSVFDKI